MADHMTSRNHRRMNGDLYKSLSEGDDAKNFIIDPSPTERISRVPILKEIQKQKHKSESAKKLATLLIENDTSWEATEPMSNQNRIKPHKYGGGATTAQQIKMHPETRDVDIVITSRTPDSPLLLATKSGCTEIVKKILEVYPQAIEHIDEDGRDILHVAIKYRRMDIYKAVINMKNPLTRLRGKIDKFGNSILHMVGLKVRDQKAEGDIRSPALVLRDDLLLFESVKKTILPIRAVESPEAMQQPTPPPQDPTTSFIESTTNPFV
ncbi:hypothetical protein L6452_35258 [Arctium lappa]|uniref:Uncharacterized protein n=1 Tax=Arctium lappa TaxID=4217 RepID=A0ACB8Y573_ARCLA|nr:hypothetical protein L6452_35258 [Arctium lappa]